MEYELQGNGSDGRAVFISEKGDSTSWHSLILNVRHKLEIHHKHKHTHNARRYTLREFKPARSKQTMNHKDRIPNSKQINLVVSKLVLVWHGCLFWCMSSCLVCYLKRKRKTFVCNVYAQNKNIERIQELSLSLIDQENKIQKYIYIKQEWKE